jgi:hypothetical protein
MMGSSCIPFPPSGRSGRFAADARVELQPDRHSCSFAQALCRIAFFTPTIATGYSNRVLRTHLTALVRGAACLCAVRGFACAINLLLRNGFAVRSNTPTEWPAGMIAAVIGMHAANSGFQGMAPAGADTVQRIRQ